MNGSWMKKFSASVFCDPERVDEGGRHVRQQQHVRLVDLLEAADRGAVEGEAVGEDVLVERLDRHVEVLHHAGQVTEAYVDELDALVLEVPQKLLGIGEHTSSWAIRARNAWLFRWRHASRNQHCHRA